MATGIPWHSLAYRRNLCLNLYLTLLDVSLIRTLVIEFRAHTVTQIKHLKVLNHVSSTKSLFPNKFIFTRLQGLEHGHNSGGHHSIITVTTTVTGYFF